MKTTKNFTNTTRCIVYTLFFMALSCTKMPNLNSDINNSYLATRALSEGKEYWYSFDEKRFLDEVPNKIVLCFDEKHFLDIQHYLQEN